MCLRLFIDNVITVSLLRSIDLLSLSLLVTITVENDEKLLPLAQGAPSK